MTLFILKKTALRLLQEFLKKRFVTTLPCHLLDTWYNTGTKSLSPLNAIRFNPCGVLTDLKRVDSASFINVMPMWWVLNLYRSEEHTSELQSRPHLVCRLLLE